MFDYTYLFSQPLVHHGYKGFLDSSAKVRTVLFTCPKLLIEILTHAFPKIVNYGVSIYENPNDVPHRVENQEQKYFIADLKVSNRDFEKAE